MKNDFLNTLEANDLRIREDLEIYCEKDKQGILAFFECWFDVNKKFGLNIPEGSNAFIDMYGMYKPLDERIELTYLVNTEDGCVERPYIPTDEENRVFSELMEQAIKAEYSNPKANCKEYYVNAYFEFYVAEQDMKLIFEKNGDEFQIRNENDDFILFKSKDATMEKYVGYRPEYNYFSERDCDGFEFKEFGEKIYFTNEVQAETEDEEIEM